MRLSVNPQPQRSEESHCSPAVQRDAQRPEYLAEQADLARQKQDTTPGCVTRR